MPNQAQTATRVEESLERVRAGMEARASRISGRVGTALAEYVSRPGKMLRARFAVQLGVALGVDPARAETVGRAMELAHNASLLHDDCVDEAALRRGQPTPNSVYGSTVALLLGDIAFTQALEEVLDLHPKAVERLTAAAREMAIGELQEEFLRGSVDVTLGSYMGVASRKTGALFEWGALTLSDLSPLEHSAADPAKLGSALGILLQMVDDIHDYTLEDSVSGKERAKDAKAGRVTLPGVFALADASSRARFLELWGSMASDPHAASEMARFLDESGALERAREKCREVVAAILTLARRLPVPGEVAEFAEFVSVMAAREF
ncbi:MAG: polyprenyl synthetase family protein [Elusimicrobia bacterium]|nr:polyprenyl synthetase family protein [Elusimicrobiota bacterium]